MQCKSNHDAAAAAALCTLNWLTIIGIRAIVNSSSWQSIRDAYLSCSICNLLLWFHFSRYKLLLILVETNSTSWAMRLLKFEDDAAGWAGPKAQWTTHKGSVNQFIIIGSLFKIGSVVACRNRSRERESYFTTWVSSSSSSSGKEKIKGISPRPPRSCHRRLYILVQTETYTQQQRQRQHAEDKRKLLLIADSFLSYEQGRKIAGKYSNNHLLQTLL